MKNFPKILLTTIISLFVLAFATITFAQTSNASTQTGFERFLANLLGMMVAPLFLMVGFSLAMQLTSVLFKPIIGGAKKTLSFGKKIGKTALGAGKIGARVAGGAAGVATSSAIGAARGVRDAYGSEKGILSPKGSRGGFAELGGAIKGGFKGAFTKQGQLEGKEAINKSVGKLPIVGAMWQRRQKKTIDLGKAEERMKGKSPNDMKNIVLNPALTQKAVEDKMQCVKSLIKDKKFDFDPATEQKLIKQAQGLGIDVSDLLKSRPDLTPTIKSGEVSDLIKQKLAKGMDSINAKEEAEKEITKSVLDKMNPAQFLENIQTKALDNKNVFSGLDLQKIGRIMTRGSVEQHKILEKFGLKREDFLKNLDSSGTFKVKGKGKDSYREPF